MRKSFRVIWIASIITWVSIGVFMIYFADLPEPQIPGPLRDPSNPFQNLFHYYWQPGPDPYPFLGLFQLLSFVVMVFGFIMIMDPGIHYNL